MTTLEFAQDLKALKPSISLSSAMTYASLLRSLKASLAQTSMIENFEFSRSSICQFSTQIIDFIEKEYKKKPKHAKQLYSALLLFDQGFQSPAKCFAIMRAMIKKHNNEDKGEELKQELTKRQKEAYMPWDEIVMKREELGNKVSHLWNKGQEGLSVDEYLQLQDYVIACLYTMMPPRRLIDYVFMKTAPPAFITDNGIVTRDDKLYFVFQFYKTAATHGQQVIPLSESLVPIIKNWLEINPTEWLIFNKEFKRMHDARVLQRRLAKIFNRKGFGVNILRHSFVSETFLKDVPFLNEMQEMATSLGHTPTETMLYKKHI